ncbi:NAD-dependent epimerase/dehydratase family protein [Streptomyces sp. SID13666]|uniref:NAD-dependent epimerase/dehydratase family protein n=1 Tax=unclassified Streptomyces TaxID=2593676 RepID=UPI0013C20E31|nr:NAD-dependent epimerase/dehydratase family protein [Streptomyces sp. H39-C1]MCZ4098961.1 NAD-dependent epimerase/dehydratase family protein [Streptomyces sp. H39-C1]NEA60721.1 NAD-dependent epimerase/dehydratase family protein [Streptomyces sp. SID13666]
MNTRDRFADLSGATVTVTGGFGLVGSRIVHRLRALGAKPLTVGRLDAYGSCVYSSVFGISPGDPDVVAGDITDAALMDDLFSRSDYVIHAAALADVAECTRNPAAALDANIRGTQTVLDAAARHRRTLKRLVFVSSASVYGIGNTTDSPNTKARFSEEDSLVPGSVYANTKLWGEHQTALSLSGADSSFAIVRYFSVYGEPQVVKENSHSWVVAWFAMRAALGLPLHLNGGGCQVRDFVHVDDIAEATLLAAVTEGADRTTLNVGTGRATSIRQVADLVRRHYPGAQIIETPRPQGDPLGACADTTRMRQVLGWTAPVDIEDGVSRYVTWLKGTPEAIPAWLRAEARAVA